MQNLWEERVLAINEANRYGKGRLSVYTSGGYRRYYREFRRDGERIRLGITKDAFQIRSLARKMYLEELIRRCDRNLVLMEGIRAAIEPTDEAAVLQAVWNDAFRLPAEAYLCTPYLLTEGAALNPTADEDVAIRPAMIRLPEPEDPWEWKTRPYRMNTKNAENRKQRMPNGLTVRSKSEAGLIQLYEKLGIPYHYDEVLWMGGRKVSPDIVGVRKDRAVILHEHCGLTEDAAYMNEHKKKMALYEAAGFVPWKNLIVTYEAEGGGIDLALAEAEIRNRYD